METVDSERGFGAGLSGWLEVLNRAVPGLSFRVRRSVLREFFETLVLEVRFREKGMSLAGALVADDEDGMVGCLKDFLPEVMLYSKDVPAVPVPLSRFLPAYSSLRELEMKLALKGVPE